MVDFVVFFFFFKQKTAYEMRISDWSSDVCSSDLRGACQALQRKDCRLPALWQQLAPMGRGYGAVARGCNGRVRGSPSGPPAPPSKRIARVPCRAAPPPPHCRFRSEEHTSELQSLMRISYAVFCLKKKTTQSTTHPT